MTLAFASDYRRPTKRWNQKGSVAAKERMGQLRLRKLRLDMSALIDEWARITGRPAREWWIAAQAAGLTAGQGVEHTKACIEFLRGEIAKHGAA